MQFANLDVWRDKIQVFSPLLTIVIFKFLIALHIIFYFSVFQDKCISYHHFVRKSPNHIKTKEKNAILFQKYLLDLLFMPLTNLIHLDHMHNVVWVNHSYLLLPLVRPNTLWWDLSMGNTASLIATVEFLKLKNNRECSSSLFSEILAIESSPKMGWGKYMCSQSWPTECKCFLFGTIRRNLTRILAFLNICVIK